MSEVCTSSCSSRASSNASRRRNVLSDESGASMGRGRSDLKWLMTIPKGRISIILLQNVASSRLQSAVTQSSLHHRRTVTTFSLVTTFLFATTLEKGSNAALKSSHSAGSLSGKLNCRLLDSSIPLRMAPRKYPHKYISWWLSSWNSFPPTTTVASLLLLWSNRGFLFGFSDSLIFLLSRRIEACWFLKWW